MEKTDTLPCSDDRIEVALFEPDIAPNVGTLMRLTACLNVAIHVIEPCGFPFSRRALKRTLMDYEPHVSLRHHADWSDFVADQSARDRRLVLSTTKGSVPITEARFSARDTLVMGSESTGAPDYVHASAQMRVRIPMRSELRSVNVATAAAMLMGEALRQTSGYDGLA